MYILHVGVLTQFTCNYISLMLMKICRHVLFMITPGQFFLSFDQMSRHTDHGVKIIRQFSQIHSQMINCDKTHAF